LLKRDCGNDLALSFRYNDHKAALHFPSGYFSCADRPLKLFPKLARTWQNAYLIHRPRGLGCSFKACNDFPIKAAVMRLSPDFELAMQIARQVL